MPQVEVRKAVLSDIDYLASNMREMCSSEGFAVSDRLTPKTLLKVSLEKSNETISIISDGNCVAMMGYLEDGSNALIWLITANEIVSMPLTLIKTVKGRLKYLKGKYSEVFSYIQSEIDGKHRNWMKWLGFEFDSEVVCFGEKRSLFRKVIYKGA